MSNPSIAATAASSPETAYLDLIYSKAMVRADLRQLVDSIVTHPDMNSDAKLGLLREVAGVSQVLRSYRSASATAQKAA
ncbi:MAG TPA: hypothetical protein VF171_02440 [Trueperaceae bacterium]